MAVLLYVLAHLIFELPYSTRILPPRYLLHFDRGEIEGGNKDTQGGNDWPTPCRRRERRSKFVVVFVLHRASPKSIKQSNMCSD